MQRVPLRELNNLRAVRDGALPDFSLQMLRDGQPLIAFAAADRWLRIAGKNVANLMLRAEALHRLGFVDRALDDLNGVLERDAFHRRALRRLADWSSPEQALAAARTLIGLSGVEIPGPDAEHGLRRLKRAGAKGAGRVRISGRTVEGWLACPGEARAELLLSGAESCAIVVPLQEDSIWATFGAGARVHHLAQHAVVRADLVVDGEVVAMARASTAMTDFGDEPDRSEPDVTIVIPVYDDFEATRDCLLAASAAIATIPGGRLLIVDDASPNPRIKAFLADFAAAPGRALLVNPFNLGFVGAVNRALRRTPSGDVLLLNADALLPPHSLERFLDIARRSPDVGIINPLSNHGEFTSYPRPFRHNAFEPARWRNIDDAAEALSDAATLDIPSGTGFCMYVTRSCLDAVGLLSEQFAEGYLEDADFGLRAREAGFRNVCTPSIYVPHIGSRSFKGAKAALVARNRLALARRFPSYESECDAFVLADPLRPARQRLDLAQANAAPIRRLVIGLARCEQALRARAERLERENIGVLLGLVESGSRGFSMRLEAIDGSAPQNVLLEETDGVNAIFDVLRRWSFDRVELVATADLPSVLRDRIRDLGRPCNIMIAESIASRDDPDSPWLRAIARADRVFGIDALSKAYSERLARERRNCATPPVAPSCSRAAVAPSLLAIVYPFQTADSLSLLQILSAHAREEHLPMIVLGSTPFDEKLRADGVFVTGLTPPEESLALLEIYGADRLLLPYRREGFWALESLIEQKSRPAAYFDWSQTGFRLQDIDLALDMSSSDKTAAEAVMAWIGAHQVSLQASAVREVA